MAWVWPVVGGAVECTPWQCWDCSRAVLGLEWQVGLGVSAWLEWINGLSCGQAGWSYWHWLGSIADSLRDISFCFPRFYSGHLVEWTLARFAAAARLQTFRLFLLLSQVLPSCYCQLIIYMNITFFSIQFFPNCNCVLLSYIGLPVKHHWLHNLR